MNWKPHSRFPARSNLLLVTLLCTLTALLAPLFLNAAERPNIVLLLSDDHSWTDYGFIGHDVVQTPNIDKLQARSATFRRGYLPTALCRPSLATLATGLYAHQHGITGNDPSRGVWKRDSKEYTKQREKIISNIDRIPTIGRMLSEVGYLSHQSGKWWEGSYERGGFTHGMTRGFPEKGGRHGDDGLKIGRAGMEPIFDFIDLAEKEKKPFYIWYAPFLPHTPHNPPERLLKKYRADGRPITVAKYYAMIDWLDETCGQLIDRIEEKGMLDNTLFVYVADNGWIQNPERNGYALRSKQSPNEGGVRSPILYSWPGVIKAGERPELTSSIDIVPTMLAAAGVDVPGDLPGLNLLDPLKSGKAIERDHIFGEGFAHDIKDPDNPQATLLYRWIIQGHHKLLLTYDGEVAAYSTTHPRDEKRPQLFDLSKDPAENNNIAADNPERVAELATKIGQWWPVTERKVLTVFE